MVLRSVLLVALCLLMCNFVQDVAYKPESEFEIKIDLSFKQRPVASTTSFDFTETRAEYERRTSTTPKPYLVLKVKINTLKTNEDRLKIYRDLGDHVMTKKKLEDGEEFDLDVGFVDDVKDGVKGYSFTINFYDAKKNRVSRIVINFDSQGNYRVNGETRGRI